MAPKRLSSFSSLPYEILQHILSYQVVNSSELSKRYSKFEINSFVKCVATFQSLNKKIGEIPEMKMYFDEFWWKMWEIWFGINPCLESKFIILKNEMIRKEELKRKVLMAKYIKFTILKRKSEDLEQFKIYIIGQAGVGKSAITISFVKNEQYVEEYSPTIEDFYPKYLNVDGVNVLLEIYDTAGYEEYKAIRDQYMRIADCFVCVCDLKDEKSLEEAETLVNETIIIKQQEKNDFPIVFALNKVDLLDETERKPIIEKFTSHVNSLIERTKLTNCFIIETSAKTRLNIDQMFEETVRRKRQVDIDNLTLLKQVMQLDSAFIKTCKKKMKQSSKNCFLM